MKKVERVREIGFLGDLATGKEEKILYEIKEKTCRIHALPGLHKVVKVSTSRVNKLAKYCLTFYLLWI